jgi:hypothetical protein
MRRQFDARQESHTSHTKPEEFSPEEQNHDADQRADNRNGEMCRVSALSGYDFKKIHACEDVLCQTPLYLISVLDTSTATPAASPSRLSHSGDSLCSLNVPGASNSLLSAAKYAK